MNKLVYQVVIALLLLLIGYLLYDGKTEVPAEILDTIEEEEVVSETAVEPSVEIDEDVSVVTDEDLILLEGVFLGFADGKDRYLGSFKYALIDDGTEVVRVDLRSIVGYDVTDLEKELGIEVGELVEVKGYLEEGEFVATLIKGG